ncbi:hypothetical protein TCDM_11344 [Trypanosoma cruzi Dm28c]|uniref:Mucin TcMUCII n=1 Tax=Trypanosoma cruzi Dm28c TaxID=1416333 RepID=V5B552_TRYCR|nr:hypothetical protein TCDM_11344 [Trypanosoma cruzi Dm28c]
MCVWAVCVLLVLSVPSNFTVAISVWLLVFLACLCSTSGEYSSNSGNTSERSARSRAEHPRKKQEKIRKGRHGGPSHTEKSSNTASHGGPSLCAGQPSRGATRHTQQGMTDSQREINGRRQDALTINMTREHAATPPRKAGREDYRRKKQAAQTNGRRGKHRHGPRPGRQLHTSPHTHTPSRCRRSADEKIRPSTTNAHTASSHPPMDEDEKRHAATASSSNPRTTGYSHSPADNTQRTRSKKSPKEPHAEAIPHPSMTRRLTPCGHTECTVSSTELMPRPSLKYASFNDGAWNTIEKSGKRGNTAIMPATIILQLRCNSPITSRMHEQVTYYMKPTQCFSPGNKQPPIPP